MTVQRQAQLLVSRDAHHVSQLLRDILASNAIYKHVREEDGGTVFVTTIKPHWWLLGTTMIIMLSPHDSDTMVKAQIISQPWIVGDAFGFYERYLSELLGAVGEADGNLI